MKTIKILLLICFALFCLTVFADKVPKERAKIVAENWGKNKMGKNSKAKIEQFNFIQGKDTSLYVFNFDDNGFVLVPSEDNTYPILAYSKTGNFDLTNLSPEMETWLRYYAEMIKTEKKIERTSIIKEKWEEVESGTFLKSTMTTVPSLFESTSSSRWASWNPYFSKAPTAQTIYHKGHNGCVPLAMSQIMNYFAFPPLGDGSNSYTISGTSLGSTISFTISESFNKFLNYDLMPFRLTYCGNGQTNCNEGSFSNIPGITQQEIDAVGELQYLAGVSVGTLWLGMRDTANNTTGTYGAPDEWTDEMVNHFYYDADYSYWNETQIENSPTNFKTQLRNSLNNSLPALFRYSCHSNGSGHAIVIDGYENNEFFHFCSGRGGFTDGYFYLFPSDNDGTHNPREYIIFGGLECSMNIHPNCDINSSITLTNTTISGSSELYRASGNISVSNTTIASGAKVYFGSLNTISITSNFSIELGAELLINNKPCGNE